MKLIKIALPILAALSLIACGSSGTAATPEATPIPTVEADDTIIAEGNLEPIHYTQLSLSAGGLISEVVLSEGDRVEAGDVIASVQSEETKTLKDAQAEASQELTEAYQEFRDARSKLDDFYVPSQFSGLTPPEAVTAMLEKLNVERANFEPYRHLDAKKLKLTEEEENGDKPVQGIAKIRKKALDNAWNLYRLSIQWLELETNFQNAQARLENAQREYDALYDPAFALDTAGIRSVLANAELRAPYSGTITNLDLKVGEYTSAGEPVVTIADVSQWVVKTKDLTEIDVVNIQEGQLVTVKLDALPDMEFNGNVLSISQEYSENQGDVVYEVTILLTDVDPAMRWGMTTVVSFE